jgi:hypothetical protein
LVNFQFSVEKNKDDRDTKLLINKIKGSYTKGEVKARKFPQAEKPTLGASNRPDDHELSHEIVHFNSKGESIEKEKKKIPAGIACKAPVQDLPKEAHHKKQDVLHKPEVKHEEHHKADHHVIHHSSSVEEHAIRFDHNGNTQEEYKDTEEHHENDVQEAPKKKKKKKKNEKPKTHSDELDHRANVNNMLNDHVVNKQLQIRDLADEDSDSHEEEDIPLITIPMVDILKQYQRMAQGFQSSTEEYSDELPAKTDHFENPHLKQALHIISAERKKGKLAKKEAKKEGKKVKPAAQRVFEDVSRSDEEL